MLSFFDIIEIRTILKQRFGTRLHYHEVLPEPYFTLDSSDQKIRYAIESFLNTKQQTAVYAPDHLKFTVVQKPIVPSVNPLADPVA